MPPVNELRWPILIGARACASKAGAARFDASTAPAPAEFLMNLRREIPPFDKCSFVIAVLPWRRDVTDGLGGILRIAGLGSLEAFRRGRVRCWHCAYVKPRPWWRDPRSRPAP